MRRTLSLLVMVVMAFVFTSACREASTSPTDGQTNDSTSASSRYDLLLTALNQNGWAFVDKVKVSANNDAAVQVKVAGYTLVIDLLNDSPVSYGIRSVNDCSRPFSGEVIALQNPDLTLSEAESILSRVSPSNFVGCPGDNSSGSDL